MKHRTGHLYQRRGTWYLQYRIAGRKIVQSLKTPSRDQAETERARIMDGIQTTNEAQSLQRVIDKLRSVQTDLARQVAPITEAWKLYLTNPSRPDSGPATLKEYYSEWSRFKRWIEKNAPSVKTLAQVTEKQAYDYTATLATAAGSTFNHHLNFMRLMWRVLNIDPDPWRHIRRRHTSTAGRRELTIDEIRIILATATGEMRLLLTLGLYTGMRLGDCCLLRWQDITAGIIRIIPAKTSRSGKPVTIPIHSALAAVLGSAGTGYILPGMADLYLSNRVKVVQTVQTYLKKCGIVTQAERNGQRKGCEVGFHSLRHTFVSLCRQAGAPLAIVEAIVGHSNPAMTRHYTHIGNEAAGAAIKLLPEIPG